MVMIMTINSHNQTSSVLKLTSYSISYKGIFISLYASFLSETDIILLFVVKDN